MVGWKIAFPRCGSSGRDPRAVRPSASTSTRPLSGTCRAATGSPTSSSPAGTPRAAPPSPSPSRLSSRFRIPFLLCLVLGARTAAAADARLDYCSLLAKCGLTPAPGLCSPDKSGGASGVTYDDARCAEARELSASAATDDPAHFMLYRFLGKRYRMSYVLSGRLPLSPARLSFVVDDLPLASKLLTVFRGKAYTAEYVDAERRTFRGSKEKTLTGEATRIAGSAREGRLVYFGYGRSKVGFWSLGGRSLAWLSFTAEEPPGKGSSYALRILVTPDNAVMNRIMGLGLFRRLVEKQIREVVQDIEIGTQAFEEEGLSALAKKGTWSAEEKARLEKFLALP
jgi:hypothetical protein